MNVISKNCCCDDDKQEESRTMKKPVRIAGLRVDVKRTPLRRAVLPQRKAESKSTQAKEFLDCGEAARFLGTSRALFGRIKNDIPHRQYGRRYFFHRDDLVAWARGGDHGVDSK